MLLCCLYLVQSEEMPVFLANCINLCFFFIHFLSFEVSQGRSDLLLDQLVGISCDMALKIHSLRSSHLVLTELGEWVMYIIRALRFDLILVQFAFL